MNHKIELSAETLESLRRWAVEILDAARELEADLRLESAAALGRIADEIDALLDGQARGHDASVADALLLPSAEKQRVLDRQVREECCDPPKFRPELFVHHEGDPVIPRLEGGFDIYHVTACAADAAIQKRLIELGWTPPPVRLADNE